MPVARIICLANSKKLRHRCFAGKTITTDGIIGEWIRPVDPMNKDSVTELMTCAGGNTPLRLLDIAEVALMYKKVSHHQKENWVFDTTTPWKRVGAIPTADIGRLMDNPDILWPGDSSGNGKNDRVADVQAYGEIKESLYLVEVENLVLLRRAGYENKPDYRAQFKYKGLEYDWSNTDLVARALVDSSPSRMIIRSKATICVSLAEAFNGYCYKLVAGILQ